jgi:hypothetical protein
VTGESFALRRPVSIAADISHDAEVIILIFGFQDGTAIEIPLGKDGLETTLEILNHALALPAVQAWQRGPARPN